MRVALQKQRDDLPASAGMLDGKLAAVTRAHAIPEPLVREACVPHRLPITSQAYRQGWNRLRAQTGAKFHTLFDAVSRAMPRSGFTLRRPLGGAYLDLLRLFLNHHRFLRSRPAECQSKSPRGS